MEERTAAKVLNDYSQKARELLSDEGKVEEVLKNVEAKLKEVPQIGEKVARLPLMLSMIRSYAVKEYTEVSPKVVVSMVAAFLYLITKKDIINDKIPVIGIVDDVAVLALALRINEAELTAYEAFRNAKKEPVEA